MTEQTVDYFTEAEQELRDAVDITIRTILDTLRDGLTPGQYEALEETNGRLRRAYAAYCFHRPT